MRVVLKTFFDERDFRNFYNLKVDGREVCSFHDGEPEDATLNRDFNDVYKIPQLMELAYKAAQKGEPFSYEEMECDSFEDLES